MADLFRDQSCMHWWLPNDEGYPSIIRNIRKFVEERSSAPKDLPAEDLRDMKAIFQKLNLDGDAAAPPGANSVKAADDIQLNVQGVTGVVEEDRYGYEYDRQQWDGNNN